MRLFAVCSQALAAGYSEFVKECRACVAKQKTKWLEHEAMAAALDGPRRDNAGPLASILLHLEPEILGTPTLV